MKRILAAIILTLGLAHGQAAKEEIGSRVVLPNPKLLRCKSSDCYQVWSEKSPGANAVCPKQLLIDTNQGCIYGLTALYDQSIAINDIKAAIDERYGKWATSDFRSSPVKNWRVESERFAIQLSVA